MAVNRDPEEVLAAFATVDHDRLRRTGLPEVVYGAGKSAAQIAVIAESLVGGGQLAMATRVDAEKGAALLGRAGGTYAPLAQLWWRGDVVPRVGRVAVACAGTSDLPVAEEAAACLEVMGVSVLRVVDVGVAGLHRVLARAEELRACDVVIVVAGMDGALPGVIAGLVSGPVVAVPTSVGYGSSFGGLAALLTMLNACAPGIAVVNIDNGFGAATLAVRMLGVGAARR
ncbi:MAG: nickel pincer cofactor biosynthesis protein LarB [Myxococcales bacterium]|nr:nickel pincer cofactor biosynthesis protein LarB [Myxococcales bacterium]